MPLISLKRPMPLIVATLCGLAAGLLAYPVLRLQAETHILDSEYAQLSKAARSAAQHAADTHFSLYAKAMELDLPQQAPGCPAPVQQMLQDMHLATFNAAAVVRVEDNRITCASLPVLIHPAALPDGYYRRADNTRLWHQLALPGAGHQGAYTLLEFKQLALLLKPEELFSRFLGEHGAVAAYESMPPYDASLRVGRVPPHWLRGLPAGVTEQQLRDPQTGDLLVRRLSNSGKTILLASRKASYIQGEVAEVTRHLWAKALLAGLCSMILTLLVYPGQSSTKRELKRALRRGQMYLVYQPVVELETGRCIGAEALMRWRQDDGSVVSPAVFIALAEQLQISHLFTEHACRILARELPAVLKTHSSFRIGVNLAAQELSTHHIVQRLSRLRSQLRLAPSQLVVELTESTLLDADRALPVINQLRANGMALAIDDFGTGYCSLSYLASYPFDILKIDRSFVSTAGTDAIIGPIAEHIVTLGKSMSVLCLAEGIETAAQAEHFRRQGVELAQGYHFAAPMALPKLLEWLQQREQPAATP